MKSICEICEKISSSISGEDINEFSVKIIGIGVNAKSVTRSVFCNICSGLFDTSSLFNYVNQCAVFLKESKKEFDDFSISLTLPLYLYKNLGKNRGIKDSLKFETDNDLIKQIKVMAKSLIGVCLSKILTKNYNYKSSFCIELVFSHPLDGLGLEHNNHKKNQFSRSSWIKRFENESNDMSVVQDFRFENEINNSEAIQSLPVLSKISCIHEPIYITGRYNKYSREVSQTPWYVDAIHKTSTSVHELISKHLKKYINGETIFSASGREDIDVCMLGNGRPFVLKCLDPLTKKFDSEILEEIKSSINKDTSLIKINDLCVANKDILDHLKEGEENKRKIYSATIVTETEIPTEVEVKINLIQNLTINQLTPVRVIHRRALCTRPRILYECKLTKITSNLYRFKAVSQAGMYIKELVHGDFGRTQPNLSTLLGIKVDIVQLDVEDIEMEWPPKNIATI